MYLQFFLLFAMIFTGYFLRKIKLIDDNIVKGLNKFVLYFAFTCLAIYNVGSLKINGELLNTIGITFLIIVFLFVAYTLLSKLYIKIRKFPESKRAIIEVSMVSPNNGFMGFPIALMFFGQEGMLFMAIHNIVFNVYIFSYGLMEIKGEKNQEKIGNKILKLLKTGFNPVVLGVIVGGIIGFSNISLENIVGEYLQIMGSMATPLAMILIGGTLAGSKFLELFKNHMVWETAFVKNLVLPMVTLLLVFWLPIAPVAKGIIVLAAAMPTGATVVMLASQEKKDTELASKILFFSTVIAMATLPMFLWLIG